MSTKTIDPADAEQAARGEWKPRMDAFGRGAAYVSALLLGLVVAVMGYISSFDNLSKYADKAGFPFGAVLPLGLDLGTPALLLLDWLRPNIFLRSAAWSLAGFTVFANGAVAGGDLKEQLIHAMLPAVAILIVEAARHLRDDPTRMDKVRMSRWFLSPIRTARLWRRMVLWEITSYREALRRESAILHARTVVASAYDGDSWRKVRKSVPLTLRHQIETGQIPSSVLAGPDLQSAVRSWVRETLAEIAGDRPVDLASAARSGQSEREDSGDPIARQWDLMWDLQDQLRPDGVPADVFAQAFGLARRQFEQVGTHIKNDDIQARLGIAKPRANAIGKALRTSYETGPDLEVQIQDRTRVVPPAVAAIVMNVPDPRKTSGLNGGPVVPAGGAS